MILFSALANWIYINLRRRVSFIEFQGNVFSLFDKKTFGYLQHFFRSCLLSHLEKVHHPKLRTQAVLHNQIRRDFPTIISKKQMNSFDQHHPNNQNQKRFHCDNHYSISNLRNQNRMKMGHLDFVVGVNVNPS